MSPIRSEDWDLAAEVERREAAISAAGLREYEREIQRLADEVVAAVLPRGEEPPPRAQPQHRFTPYPNPNTHEACVRCDLPRGAHVRT